MSDFLKWIVSTALRMISWINQTLKEITIQKERPIDYRNLLMIIDEAYLHDIAVLEWYIATAAINKDPQLKIAKLCRRQIR